MILAVDGVVKRLGGRRILDGLDLRIDEAAAVAVVGENGAGKTTLLRVVAGILEPDLGDVRVCGESIVGRHAAGRRRLGYAPESADPPEHLTVAELLALVAALKRAPSLAPALVDRLAIGGLLGHRIGALSLGQRRRACLAAALIGPPDLLVFDEPTDGLDEASAPVLVELVREQVAGGGAALIATHDRAFIGAVGARTLRLAGGRIESEV